MIAEDVKYIGVNDHTIDLFEGQYEVPNGMAYNSYVIVDEKIAVMDTVDAGFVGEWLEKLDAALDGRTPDYLIVQHMEPDHSSGIAVFAERYPAARIVATDKAFAIMKRFFGTDFADRADKVGDGDTLSLGRHTLAFYTAPMVHWPEVMMTYDSYARALFSADAFGKFGALDCEEDWACEARRYYIGIVGKYGVQVQSVLKKLSGLDIAAICPLHGPALTENLGYYLNLYDIWSSYGVESEGVTICYTSVYGNTEKAVKLLKQELLELGCPAVALNDLARCDMFEAVEDAFRYGKLVLATTTYNGEIFPFMREFINHLCERGYKNRTVGIIENGSWAPAAGRVITKMLEGCKNLSLTETTVTIHSTLSAESEEQIKLLAREIV